MENTCISSNSSPLDARLLVWEREGRTRAREAFVLYALNERGEKERDETLPIMIIAKGCATARPAMLFFLFL